MQISTMNIVAAFIIAGLVFELGFSVLNRVLMWVFLRVSRFDEDEIGIYLLAPIYLLIVIGAFYRIYVAH